MKKSLLFFGSLFIISISFGQTKDKAGQTKDKTQSKDKVKIKEKIGPLDCWYTQSIKAHKDTTLSIIIGFQNEEFTDITNIKSVEFNITSDTTNVQRFVSHLRSAIRDIAKDTAEYNPNDEYYLQVTDFSGNIYLFDTKGSGEKNIHISKDDAQKLVDWIERCVAKK